MKRNKFKQSTETAMLYKVDAECLLSGLMVGHGYVIVANNGMQIPTLYDNEGMGLYGTYRIIVKDEPSTLVVVGINVQ